LRRHAHSWLFLFGSAWPGGKEKGKKKKKKRRRGVARGTSIPIFFGGYIVGRKEIEKDKLE